MTHRTQARIYLDYNATAPCREEVLAVLMRVTRDTWGNPSSLHREGQQARDVVEDARERIAGALGADAAEIVFTSGGTEADNLAIQGTVAACGRPRPRVVTSAVEHPAVLEACRTAEHRGMLCVISVRCDARGRVAARDVGAALDAGTVLVSIMHANNEVGTIQPVREIAELAVETQPLESRRPRPDCGRPVNAVSA